MDLNFLCNFSIRERVLLRIQLVHFRVRIDNINTLRWNPSMEICNCIAFSVPQSPEQRVNPSWKRPNDTIDNVSLDISSLLQYLLFHSVEELFGLHQQRTFHFHIFTDILLGEIVEGQGSHGEPNYLIAMLINAVDQVVVAMMQIIISNIIVVKSPDIVFSEGAIDVADDQPVLVSVQVNFCSDGKLFDFEFDCILTIFQIQRFQLIRTQLRWLKVSNVVHCKFYIIRQGFIHEYFDFGARLRVGRIGPNADEKFGGSKLPIFTLDNNNIGDSFHQAGLVEGGAEYAHCLSATAEHYLLQLLTNKLCTSQLSHTINKFIRTELLSRLQSCKTYNSICCMANHMLNLFLIFLLLVSFCFTAYVAPIYAEWAHHHVVWINGKEQNEERFLKMIDDYQKHQIKVGGALIDSAWSTGFNNFEWDKNKFQHPEQIIKKLHAKDIRVILWVTSMINNDTNIFKEASQKKYLLNNGKIAKWWHGHGAFLDYLNPEAVQWWHKLMDKVLNIGVDGFKCDGTDPITFLLKPWPYSSHAKRLLGPHEYGHRYYGDFYNYTKSKNEHALIMARPTDSYKTYASWNYAPKYVMFSGWVGDQDSSSEGLRKAMYNVLKSAWNGYLNFGFDIGGYRGQNISKNIFLRWVQVGSLLPFMENGGNGKHQPWSFDEETVKIYRNYVDLHYKLKPTFLTCASQNYAHKKSVITPLAKKIPQDTVKLPETYSYLLCDNLLVSPVFEENGQAEIVFPQGSNWVYYFDTTKVFQGGSKRFFTFSIDETPLFMKSNSIITLENEILIVALKPETTVKKTIIFGAYSDQLLLEYTLSSIKVSIKRYFKNDDLFSEGSVKIRLIGFRAGNGSQQQDVEIKTNGEAHLIQNVEVIQQYLEESNTSSIVSQ